MCVGGCFAWITDARRKAGTKCAQEHETEDGWDGGVGTGNCIMGHEPGDHGWEGLEDGRADGQSKGNNKGIIGEGRKRWAPERMKR